MIVEGLARRAAEGKPVKVAIVGAGRFGTTVAAQIGQMKGMRLAVLADTRRENALAAWQAAGRTADDVVDCTTADIVADAISAGKPVIVPDAMLAASSPVDVIVEVTGNVEIACRVATTAFNHGIHMVNVTVESEVLCGARFRALAEQAGVVYTAADGDQPAVTYKLWQWATALGFRVTAAGRGTRFFPGDAEGLPEEAFARYGFDPELTERRRFNPQMYNSFRDGSKAQIEMCALANATGLVPDKRGMHEPSAGVADLPSLFRLRSEGGLLSREGVVDLANAVSPDGKTDVPGAQASGVWVVVTTENPILREDMAFYGLPANTEKTHAVHYRPFHLCGLEMPLSVAEAGLFGWATMAPLPKPVADVMTVAKRDLKAGEVLDGSGGRSVRGQIDLAEIARTENSLPLTISKGAKLLVDVSAGDIIRWNQVALDESSVALRLRREQDAGW